MIEVRRPARLAAGDRVAVVAPAGPLDGARLEIGLKYLRDWGLEVEVMPAALGRHDKLPYLASEDTARAADFRAAWLEPDFKAVICARGGYGVQRMLQHLDVEELAAVDKILVGFSDITALHEVLNARGLVTIHGPMAAAVEQLGSEQGRDRLRDLLFAPESVTDLLAPAGARSVVPGTAEGRLLGGNLALLAASLGTPTFARPAGIVVLEDVGEDGYRIDRLLTQLLRSGWFDQVSGLVIGDFTESDSTDLVAEVIRERLVPLGVPMLEGAAVGHAELNLALPLGLPVRLEGTRLTPLLPALS
ncbi:muramoyltetrapeptide carboxypeptidase [Kribbella voronezhensis]|uniref:Muramoyltetrapeptide carboxypeptidase n=1 Tax=Kribbella voronezhensis TaxID=2512212 RepID=A0A4R7TC84_9ACTN|nr:LD-carboxypeptidase [Kribbella voronezhensis]TDU89684.1 muramoyltetrapeptide carboxypeptidase [Kribbella voronezhensis]